MPGEGREVEFIFLEELWIASGPHNFVDVQRIIFASF